MLARRTFIDNCCGLSKCPGLTVFSDVQVMADSQDKEMMASLKQATRPVQSRIVTLGPYRFSLKIKLNLNWHRIGRNLIFAIKGPSTPFRRQLTRPVRLERGGVGGRRRRTSTTLRRRSSTKRRRTTTPVYYDDYYYDDTTTKRMRRRSTSTTPAPAYYDDYYYEDKTTRRRRTTQRRRTSTQSGRVSCKNNTFFLVVPTMKNFKHYFFHSN